MSLLTQLGGIKYKCARAVEGNPLLSNLVYNNISKLKFLFPHEKDYYGIPFFCDPGDGRDFLDIGANIGLSAIGFRKLGYKNRIVMFEANPFLASFLENLKRKDAGLEVHQVALGNENVEREIFLAYYKGTCLHTFSSFDRDFIMTSLKNSFPEKWRDVDVRAQKVSVRRYDDLKMGRPVQFVKIDVEGFEYEILKGMTATIKRDRPVLLVEYNRANFDKVFDALGKDYALHSYSFQTNSTKRIDPADIGRLTDPSDPLRIRNLFFVPA